MATIEEKFSQFLTKNGKRIKCYTWRNKDGIINIDNHKIYARYLEEKLGYTKMEDWYKITYKDFLKNMGRGLMEYYRLSPSLFLKAMFPKYKWLEWRFAQSPQKLWKDENNHKRYAEWLDKELGYTKMEDWYKITGKDFADNYGGGLLRSYYHGSPSLFLKAMFPKYKWLEWKFTQVISLWKDKNNHKRYAEWLDKELGHTKMEDWYEITCKDFADNYGGGLLEHYHSSPSLFLKAMFRKYKWLEWKFGMVPQGFWQDENNHKRYAEWLEEELGYTKMEDWYKITGKDFADNCGGGLLKSYYHSSPSLFLKAMFPKYKWLEWRFTQSPQKLWQDKNNHKRYAEWLGKELRYTKTENWYKITCKDFADNYGGGLLVHHYRSSACQFVMAVVRDDYEWDISKFKKNYSRGQIQWLEFLIVGVPDIRHILNHNDGEFYVTGSREFCGGGTGFHTDGFSEKENMIYEYLGDFFHGNPAIYDQGDINKVTKTTYGELYNNELKRQKFCEDSGFGYHSIWESEWHRGIKVIRQLQRKFKKGIRQLKNVN